MSQPTAGLTVRPDDGLSFDLIDADGRLIATVWHDDGALGLLTRRATVNVPLEEAEANARLWARSARLYDAARALAAHLHAPAVDAAEWDMRRLWHEGELIAAVAAIDAATETTDG